MNNFLLAFLGIHAAIMNRGRIIYARIIPPAIIISSLFFMIGFGFNFAGSKGINLFFSLILVIMTIACSLRAEVIVNLFFASIISGIIQTPQTMPEEIKKFFSWYTGLIGQVLLWNSIVFFFLGTINVKGHIGAFVGILTAVVLLQLIQSIWKIGIEANWGKKFVYYYALVMLFAFVCSLFFSGATNTDVGIFQKISNFVKTHISKTVQNQNYYQISKDTQIYTLADGKLSPATDLKYSKPMITVISLNETVEINGAVYEKLGLPDETTGQPGKYARYVFSGDLQPEYKAEEAKRAEKAGANARAKSSADEISRRELEKESTGVKTPVAIINLHPEQGETMDTKILPAGTYSVSPSNSEVRIEGKWSGLEKGGVLRLKEETAVGFFPPRGTKTVSIYRKEGG